MSRLRLGRKSARRPLIEALEDRSLPSVVSFGELASPATDRGADTAQAWESHELRDHGAGHAPAGYEHGHGADQLEVALDSAKSWEMAAPQADEARHGKASEARAEQKSSRVREFQEARDEIRQDSHADVSGDAKKSRGRNDDDRQQRKEMRDEFKADWQTRTADKDKKASQSKSVDKKNDAVGKDDATTAVSPDKLVERVTRVIERTTVVESETAGVIERTAELKVAARANPANISRVKTDDGQFVLSAEDKTPVVQGAPERSAEITRAQLDFPDAASKSDSHRLTIEDLGRAPAGGVIGRVGGAAEAGEQARITILSYAAGAEITASEGSAALVGAGFASGEMQVSTSALDEALRQFAVGADEVVRSLARGLSGSALLPWLLAAGAAAATLEVQRRRKRLQPSIPEKPSLAADSELRWAPGMPGSFSDDHA